MLYIPKDAAELRTPVMLLIPQGNQRVNGVNRPVYPETGDIIYVCWKSRGGTETTVNGVYSVIDTADVTTWFRPDIKSNCRLKKENGAVYEIKNEPENVEEQNIFLRMKVERVKGGA